MPTAAHTDSANGDIDDALFEERRREDHSRRAEVDESACPRRSANAAADAARESRADRGDERLVCPRILGSVEIDQLDLGIASELPDPAVEVTGFNRQPLTLHELDDAAALKID